MSKVLLIPNIPNWALDKNARDLVKYNKSDLQLDICYYDDFEKDWQKYYEEYDLLFPLFKGLLKNMLKKNIPVDSTVTGIRSFYYWDKGKTQPPGYNSKPPRKIIRMLKKALLVNTNCKKLWYVFSKYLPVIHTKYTCDINMYYPEKKSSSDKLIVGWAGSLTNHPKKRGFDEFIKPICESIPNVELKVQASEDKMITDDNEMRKFYNSIDLYFNASRAESGPRPVLEASACGVPSLSTDVGLIPELIDNGKNGFIEDRNYDALKSRLQWIADNRDILPDMGNKIREKMEAEFNWENLVFQWTDFLKYALEIKREKNRNN